MHMDPWSLYGPHTSPPHSVFHQQHDLMLHVVEDLGVPFGVVALQPAMRVAMVLRAQALPSPMALLRKARLSCFKVVRHGSALPGGALPAQAANANDFPTAAAEEAEADAAQAKMAKAVQVAEVAEAAQTEAAETGVAAVEDERRRKQRQSGGGDGGGGNECGRGGRRNRRR